MPFFFLFFFLSFLSFFHLIILSLVSSLQVFLQSISSHSGPSQYTLSFALLEFFGLCV